MKDKNILPAYCDRNGNVYEYQGFEGAFRAAKKFTRASRKDLIKLPRGSVLFSLPNRSPVFYNKSKKDFEVITKSIEGRDIWAVSSFLSSGYLRTHLPAFINNKNAPLLSLWAYTGVVIIDGDFYAPALRIDEDPRSDPILHQNDDELDSKIKDLLKKYPANPLVKQLSLCSTEYRCLCARNFFLSRYEAPIPTTPACNAGCAGCLSKQEESGFSESQYRINFKPAPEEIAEVILHHLENVHNGIVSFGQGCEGEPLLRGRDLSKAVEIVRGKRDNGAININTNGSLPEMVELLIKSGIDSIRISLNSPTREYYTRYFNPVNYTYDDVLKSFELALKAGIFVSINLFFLPGFTDMETEVESLHKFLRRFPVNMIQTRNINIDPDYYLDSIGFRESKPIGVRPFIKHLREEFPSLRLGYYNPPKETF